MKHRFIVEIEATGIKNNEIREYIADAIKSMRGCYSPDTAVFDLDPRQMKVTRFTQTKKAEPK